MTALEIAQRYMAKAASMFHKIAKFLRAWINLRAGPAIRLRTRYTRTLEEEIARLRAENYALVNSILGVAGIPPMRSARVAESTLSTRESDQPAGKTPVAALDRPSLSSGKGREDAQPAAPLRRRSWQQIGRALEIEDARAAQREREVNADTFPAPRQIVPRV